MPIPLVNSIASWFLKKRFHQIELFLKYPNEVQNELLFSLLQTAKDTEIGKQHGFESIKTYSEFANRVPISNYEGYQHNIERARQGYSRPGNPFGKPLKATVKGGDKTAATANVPTAAFFGTIALPLSFIL